MDRRLLKLGKKTIGVLLSLLLIAINFLPQMQVLRELENGENIYDYSGLSDKLNGYVPIKIYDADGEFVANDMSQTLNEEKEIKISVCGIPVKSVSLVSREKVMLMPGGASIGVRLRTLGALIVGFGDVLNSISPAKKAGLKVGDIVVEINGVKIESADNVTELCNENTDEEITVKVLRNNEYKTFKVKKELDVNDSEYKLGMWVRDSTVGIGTLSFYKMSDKKFGALGHAITDADTGSLLIAQNGDIVLARVTGINMGKQGIAGELLGEFSSISRKLGSIEKNSNNGLYGKMYTEFTNNIYPEGLVVGYSDEVKEGEATILTTVDTNGIAEYKCKIEKVYRQSERKEKDMVVKITDEELIKKTGGIVQGMSGSPIIQSGKIVGAVTHVMINDPTRGYGIFIENMLDAVE